MLESGLIYFNDGLIKERMLPQVAGSFTLDVNGNLCFVDGSLSNLSYMPKSNISKAPLTTKMGHTYGPFSPPQDIVDMPVSPLTRQYSYDEYLRNWYSTFNAMDDHTVVVLGEPDYEATWDYFHRIDGSLSMFNMVDFYSTSDTHDFGYFKLTVIKVVSKYTVREDQPAGSPQIKIVSKDGSPINWICSGSYSYDMDVIF